MLVTAMARTMLALVLIASGAEAFANAPRTPAAHHNHRHKLSEGLAAAAPPPAPGGPELTSYALPAPAVQRARPRVARRGHVVARKPAHAGTGFGACSSTSIRTSIFSFGQ